MCSLSTYLSTHTHAVGMENHVNNVTSGGLTSAGTPEDPYVVLVQDVANAVAKEPTNFTAPKDVYDLLSI